MTLLTFCLGTPWRHRIRIFYAAFEHLNKKGHPVARMLDKPFILKIASRYFSLLLSSIKHSMMNFRSFFARLTECSHIG